MWTSTSNIRITVLNLQLDEQAQSKYSLLESDIRPLYCDSPILSNLYYILSFNISLSDKSEPFHSIHIVIATIIVSVYEQYILLLSQHIDISAPRIHINGWSNVLLLEQVVEVDFLIERMLFDLFKRRPLLMIFSSHHLSIEKQLH